MRCGWLLTDRDGKAVFGGSLGRRAAEQSLQRLAEIIDLTVEERLDGLVDLAHELWGLLWQSVARTDRHLAVLEVTGLGSVVQADLADVGFVREVGGVCGVAVVCCLCVVCGRGADGPDEQGRGDDSRDQVFHCHCESLWERRGDKGGTPRSRIQQLEGLFGPIKPSWPPVFRDSTERPCAPCRPTPPRESTPVRGRGRPDTNAAARRLVVAPRRRGAVRMISAGVLVRRVRKVTITDVEPDNNPREIHEKRRPVSDALGTEHVAVNHFRLKPGEEFSPGLHAHRDQEEVFYLQSGTATFVCGADRETVAVEAGEMIRFAPGEFQTGQVPEDADEEVIALAIGAPGPQHNWGEELESLVYCRTCEAERPHASRPTGDGFALTCKECGTRFTF